MSITNSQVEALIERLADKTLSNGCMVVVDELHVKISHKNYAGNYLVLWDVGNAVVARTVKEKKINKVLGHLIYLHRVLALTEKTRLHEYKEARSERITTLFYLWYECGIERSLQEIIGESGWEEFVGPFDGVDDMVGYLNAEDGDDTDTKAPRFQVLKSPEARALFEYLLSLFPET